MKRLFSAARRAVIATWVGVHFFRFWTAATVIILFALSFVYAPELLTTWHTTVFGLVEDVSRMFPHPWGIRLQYIMINVDVSIWLKFTMAIILLRVLMWSIAHWWRSKRNR